MRKKTSRREFLRTAAAAGSVFAIARGRTAFGRAAPLAQDQAAAPGQAATKLSILILGGTGFIGPHQVEAARARGHDVTLFNRGKTRPNLFPDLEHLQGDRDPNEGDGLKALEGRTFDAVIDNSGYVPRHVKASADLLAPHVKQYVFVSSISAYADGAPENSDETAPVATMPDPTVEEMGTDYVNYGPLKALCEQAAETAMEGRAAIVRPGYIVGPGDGSDRFTFWPLRVSQGGEMIAPGTKDDPIQVIDGRDLGAWIVKLVEDGTTGTFNAVGPKERLGMGAMLEACKRATKSDATFTWVTPQFLQANEVRFDIWAPYEGETKGFHTWSNERAVAAGLTFRPIEAIAKDTLEWFHQRPADRQQRLLESVARLRAREPALLEKWKNR